MRRFKKRRKFIKDSSMAAVSLGVFPKSISYLKNKRPAEQINVAVMGVCNRGRALANAFAAAKDCVVKYLCEVDKRCVADVLSDLEDRQTDTPKVEEDIRKVLEDPEIDAVVIAAPDHWHAPAAIMACQAGKHVYVEKPCSHNPQEGEWLVTAARKYNRIVQMGNQRRTWSNVQACMRDIHSGLIGNVYYANAWYVNGREPIGFGSKTSPPSELNFDLWQGPAPRRAYQDNLHPYNWHWFWHWGTGEALNNGTHFLDLMRWGLQVDYPSYVTSTGGRFHYKDDWETPDTQMISLEFAEGKSMTWESRSCSRLRIHGQTAGVSFHGEGGCIVLQSGNAYTVYDNDRNPKIVKEVKAGSSKEHNQQDTYGPGLLMDIGHVENFLSAIRNGTTLNSEIEGGHKSVLLCQLGNIAYRTKSGLQINPVNGHIVGNSEAEKLWSRNYEPGWEVRI